MKSLRFIPVFALLAAAPAAAQPAERPPLAVPAELADGLYTYLVQGGTHAEGAALARQLAGLVRDGQRDATIADLRRQLDAIKNPPPPPPDPQK
jgi:hypothetical protein